MYKTLCKKSLLHAYIFIYVLKFVYNTITDVQYNQSVRFVEQAKWKKSILYINSEIRLVPKFF